MGNTVRYAWIGIFLVVLAGLSQGGQRRREGLETSQPESIADLRAYQEFHYATGGRDPMVMRLQTDGEKGLNQVVYRPEVPTREAIHRQLSEWLAQVNAAMREQDYDRAIQVGKTAAEVMETHWPRVRDEDGDLAITSGEIRRLAVAAARLRKQQDIGLEFAALGLKVDGISWSHSESKAVVNGKAHTAGEILLSVRSEGDLRLERIEERGVVFRFQGMRFRVPISLYN